LEYSRLAYWILDILRVASHRCDSASRMRVCLER